jgi:MHS family proline/betaine transporter-like MFS transporter
MDAHVEGAAARKAVMAGAIGNFVEWYDYSVYGFFATVIASQFFPSEDPVAPLLATFAVFAVAFFMRPVGAFVFGHYGDTIGRWNTLAAPSS